MGQAQTTRTNRMQAVIGAFSVGVACRLLGIGAANAAVSRPAMGWLLYVVPLAACVLGALMTQWHIYPRRPSKLARITINRLDAAWGAAARLWTRPAASSLPARLRG
jgi:hypothetical protein